ncbi:MAG: hypothetical protein IKC65_02620 [Lentisphaeria bacterium]|nr:hypothetical protein [Lentisphaeria bacterium]
MFPMWRIKFIPAFLTGILLLSALSAGAAEQGSSLRKLKAVRPYREPVEVTRHRERILKVYAAQDVKLAKADKLTNDLKFKEAVAICEEVIAELELELAAHQSHVAKSRVEMTRNKIAEINRKWSRDLLTKARHAAADKRYDDCISIATLAGTVSPAYRDEANALVEYGMGMKRNDRKAADVDVKKILPGLDSNNAELKKLLAEAKVYLRNKKLVEARETIERAFVVNPYDSEAIAIAGEIYRQLYNQASSRRKTDVAAVMAYAAWQWSEPTFNLVPPGSIPAGEKRSIGVDSEKLRNIRFARFHFDDADLEAVFSYIETRSKDGDPEKDERYKGVKVSRTLNSDFLEKNRVTLSLDNVSLASVLDCLSLLTGLKYTVNTGANGSTSVHFASQTDDMITHEWDAPRNFTSIVAKKEPGSAADAMSNAGLTAAAGGGGGGPLVLPEVGEGSGSSGEDYDLTKDLGSRQSIEISPAELRKYFSARGVTFPPRSAIYYSPRTRKIKAKNTRENIYALDTRIYQIAAADKPLVMVEIKAIEISETDYQDLGFEWTLGTLSSGNMDTNYGRLTSGSSGWMLGPGVNSLPNGAINAIRGGVSKNETKAAIVNNWNIFPSLFGSTNPFGSDIPLNISLTINALSRSDRTETLSAPKIVTQNGVRATVNMQTTYYFPESWEELEVEVTTSGDGGPVTRISPPVPEFNEDGESLGITFSVVPTIRKNRDIGLEIDVALSSYVGPDNYQITIYGENRYYDRKESAGGLMQDVLVTEKENYNFTIWRPIISQRGLKTSVDVSDGETLVLGGMVENHTFVRVDKVPLLGDLPLIGRFFQSQAENSERQNLLLFVTARLIDDHGMPIKRNLQNALPEYNR